MKNYEETTSHVEHITTDDDFFVWCRCHFGGEIELTDLNFSSIVGQVVTKITTVGRNAAHPHGIIFETAKRRYGLGLDQECSGSVYIADICGDLDDLVGSPILSAQETAQGENVGESPGASYSQNFFAWTFYTLSTTHGSVTLRWLGLSSGYHAVTLSFRTIT